VKENPRADETIKELTTIYTTVIRHSGCEADSIVCSTGIERDRVFELLRQYAGFDGLWNVRKNGQDRLYYAHYC
jgi:hypothetical protein